MFIPTEILKQGNFEKAARHRSQKRIFKDKVVDARLSPLLFHIESGIEEMSHVAESRYRSLNKCDSNIVTSDRGYQAREMLLQSNIACDNEGKGFSLLKRQSNKPGLKSKNLMDERQFKQTKNQNVVAHNQFPNQLDPFYDLDENENSNRQYQVEKDMDGKAYQVPDLSLMAAGIAVTNLSKNYKGKSKYFTKTHLRSYN